MNADLLTMCLVKRSLLLALLLLTQFTVLVFLFLNQFLGLADLADTFQRGTTNPMERYSSPWLTATTQSKPPARELHSSNETQDGELTFP